MHVVAGGARLAVPALKKKDLLCDAGGDGGGQPALAGRDPGEASCVGSAGTKGPTKGVAEHGGGDGSICGGGVAARAVTKAGEEREAVRAAGCGVGALPAQGGDDKAVLGKPDQELVDQVQDGVTRAADCRVMPFSLTVVLAATYVDRGGALEAGNALARVEAEPQVADLQSSQLRDSEAADGGKADHQTVALVP